LKKKQILNRLLTLGVIAVIGVAGISAYFTASDLAKNSMTIQEVAVDLIEPDWVDGTETVPNQTVPKDPQVVNTGSASQFVFLKVDVPYKNIITANDDGTRNEAVDIELFDYSVNEGWVLVKEVKNEDAGTVEKIYAYAKDGVMTELAEDATTETALFDTVTMANVVEGQG